MIHLNALSPLVFILISSISFTFYILTSKYLILESSLLIIIFFRFIFMSIIELLSIRQKLTLSFKISNPGIHFLLSFVNLGFYYCFFQSLSELPLISAVAIYLAYPLFVPFILRVWMGRKFKALYAFGVYLAWIGILLTFDAKFKLNNILIVVASISSLLKAVSWVGYHRLNVGESPILTWIIKYFTAILAGAILLAPSLKVPASSPY